MPYINALYCAAISSLADRREQLSCKFFKSIQEPSSCLSVRLPNQQDPPISGQSAKVEVGERYIQVWGPDNGRVPFPSIITI